MYQQFAVTIAVSVIFSAFNALTLSPALSGMLLKPRKQGRGGRNHWGGLAPLLLAGGGLKMGQVVGESDRIASVPKTTPYKPSHLLATVMHTLLDVGQLRLQNGMPRELVQRIETGAPIVELV